MNLSLKTKFYIYVVPIIVLLPVLLYTLVAPYTGLRDAFVSFRTDAGRAKEAEEFAELIDNEQLELFHLVGSRPAVSYDPATEPGAADFEKASQAAAAQFKTIQSEVVDSVASYDEERAAINNVGEFYGQFTALTGQALALSAQGKKQQALDLLGGQVADVVDEYLRPEIEKLELIKEDDVKTSLPDLTDTLSRRGVIPIPGLQNKIFDVISHFENSVDTERTGQLLNDLQISIFDYALAPKPSADDAASYQADIGRIQNQISKTLADIHGRLSPAGDQDELTKLAALEGNYKNLVVLNAQAQTLVEAGKQQEALALLEGGVDAFVEGSLRPSLEDLIQSDEADVARIVTSLSGELDRTVYLLYSLSALLFLLGIGSLWKLSRDIIAPIIKLRNATLRLAAGDFTTQVPVTSKDEIGELAGAFNGMASKLRDSYSHLEEKVHTQTATLLKQVDELESTKKATTNLLEDLNQEKAKIQEAQAKDEAILSSIGDGLVVCDLGGAILSVNKAFEDTLGWRLAEVQGKKLAAVIAMTDEKGIPVAPERRLIAQALEQKTMQATSDVSSTYYERKDGTRFPVFIAVTPIYLGQELLGAVEVFRDITREREIDKAKSEFVSLASHQLRTPLSAIGWYAELLGDSTLTKDQKELLIQVQDSNKRMVELVNSLLNVSRIDLGTLASEPVSLDLADLIDSVASELMPQITERKIKLAKEYPKPLAFSADPRLMRIVIQNLFSNAVKYTPPEGSVAVSLSLDEKLLHIKVADTGYGIPAAQQGKIFTKLFRADNAKEKEQDGNGLGLYIVKSIVESNGGKVWFESQENKGTTFYVDLPASGMKKMEGSRTLS